MTLCTAAVQAAYITCIQICHKVLCIKNANISDKYIIYTHINFGDAVISLHYTI